MTYKEIIQALWDNQIKPRDERKDYVIKNACYSPCDVKDIESWGDGKPADWDHFGIGVLSDGGFFRVIVVLFAYSDLKEPTPLSVKLIESDDWELIERINK